MGDLLSGINDAALDLATSPWAFLIVFAISAIDAFFPPIPAESVVVALAAIGISTGEPSLVLLAVAAGVGAFLGDNIAFRIGRAIGVDRFHPATRPRLARAVEWARHEIDRRAVLLILTARYVPVGRTAVNMTAGATDFPFRRFLPLSALAATTWAIYSVAIGVIAGSWVKDHPLYGAAIAIAVAALVGFVADRTVQWRRRRRAEHSVTE